MLLYPTAVEKFVNHPTSPARAESTITSMRTTVRLFQSDHPGLELHEVTPRHLEEWLGAKRANGVSDATVKKYLQRLQSLLDWCSWQRLIDSNPAEHLAKVLRLRPQPVRTHRWLEESEVKRLLDSVETLTIQGRRDAIILRLGFTAGLRNNEIRRLPMSSLDGIETQRIEVKGKGGKLAQVWVPERTGLLLSRWREEYVDPRPDDPVVIAFRSLQDWSSGDRGLFPQWGVGITQQALGRIVAARSDTVGLRVAPHDMRRSYAGIMESKTDVVATSRALRHSQIATTQLYLERRQDSAYQAARSAELDF